MVSSSLPRDVSPPDRSRSAQTFWIQQLTGAPFLLELPSDRSRPPQPSGQRRSEPFQWNGTLRQAVAAQAVQAHCGVEQVILGAFLAFLHRYSGQTDVVIGILPDQKTETLAKLSIEASNTAGNTDVLALRSRCGIARETAPSFAEFLQRTIATTTKINGFSNFPYAFLRQHFNIAPSRSYSPWFQVLFQFRSSPGTEPIVKPQAKPAYSQAERPQAELSQVELSQPEPSKSKNPHPENPKSGGDLVLSIDDRGQELRGILDYNPDLWDRETIANFLEHFQGFIGALVQNSQTPIAQIPLLSSQQRDWLQQWNPAPTPYSAGTVLELIAAQAQRSPQARAVVAPPEMGEVSPMRETPLDSTLSYSEMMAQAAQISHFLAQRGIGEGQCVGLALGRSIYLVTAVLGVMGSGAAYVPLDPSYPADRLQFMAQDAGLSWVLTDRASFAQLHWLTDPQSEGARSEIPTSASPATEIPVSNGPDRSRSPDPPVPESQPESQPGLQSVLNSPKPSQKNLGLQNVSAIEDILNPSPHSTATSSPVFPLAQPTLAPNSPRPSLAYIIYTSGSTGQPKGVAIGHSSLVNFLEAMQQQLHLTPEDTWLALTTLSFDIAALELLLPLMVGATVAIAPQASQRDGFLLAQTITQTQATVIQATPTTWQLLRLAQWTGEEQQPQAQPQPNRQGRENPDVSAPSTPKRQLLCGGEALTPPIARFLLQAAGPQGQVWNLYGPTETTIWSLIQPVTPELVHRYDRSASLPIGLPLANTQVYVLDAAQQLCGVGQPGEIYLGGAGLAQGYWQRPQLSADRFPWLSLAPIDASNQAEPLVLETQRQRLYRTGDRGRWHRDGWLEFLGRVDYQVKLRGHRLELGEVEQALERHPQIDRAVVRLWEPPAVTPAALVAYGVPHRAENPPDSKELRQFLRQSLPDYMIPSTVILLADLPRTANGKVDRRSLPAPPVVAPQPNPDSGTLTIGTPGQNAGNTRDQEQSATLTARLLHQAWTQALNLETIAPDDHFFDVGGNSLLAMEITLALKAHFPQLRLGHLFQYPTLAELTQFLNMPRESEAGAETGTGTDGSGARSSLPISLLHQGDRSLPLFVVNALGQFRNLVPHLNPHQTVYGLSIFGLDLLHLWDPDSPAPLTLPSFAHALVQRLRTLQPQGPYALAAYCGDTYVIWEMAHQLQQQGERVSFLGFVDTIWEEKAEDFGLRSTLKLLQFYGLDYLVYRLRRLIHAPQPRRSRYSWFGRGRNSRDRTSMPVEIPPEVAIDPTKAPKLALQPGQTLDNWLYDQFLAATNRYQPPRHAAPVTLFLSKEYQLKHNGLSQFIQGSLETVLIDSYHHNIFQLPPVASFGQQFQASLDRALDLP